MVCCLLWEFGCRFHALGLGWEDFVYVYQISAFYLIWKYHYSFIHAYAKALPGHRIGLELFALTMSREKQGRKVLRRPLGASASFWYHRQLRPRLLGQKWRCNLRGHLPLSGLWLASIPELGKKHGEGENNICGACTSPSPSLQTAQYIQYWLRPIALYFIASVV